MSAHKHFTGQTRNIDIDEALTAEGEQPATESVTSRGVTLDELKQAVADGTVDTVLLAIADMEGRLQGKRLTAAHFLDDVLEHGAEGCNYLLAVDVDMETVGGYAMSSWERGYGDFEMKSRTSTRCGRSRGTRARCCCSPTCSGTTAPRWSPRRARSCAASSPGSPSAA